MTHIGSFLILVKLNPSHPSVDQDICIDWGIVIIPGGTQFLSNMQIRVENG